MYRVSREASRGVEPVLIDLGLLKKCDVEESRIEEIPSVTLVDGHAAGAGTPRYCAPEQFSGGSLSPASDVHALGVLADECFGGRAPRAWARIISRATSSLPSHRYRDVDSFVRAIRRRYRMRRFLVCGFAALAVGIICTAKFVGGSFSKMSAGQDMRRDGAGAVPQSKFESGIDYADDGSFGENMMTNVVSEELLSVTYTTNRFGDKTPSSWSYRVTTNTMPVTLVRLDHQEKTFRKPIRLEVGREYRIVGPGILDAAFEKPNDTVRVVLENCFFNNRSTDHPETAKIRYALTEKAEMNFTEFENVIKGDKFFEPYDYWTSKICFGKKDAMEYFRRKLKNPAKIVIKHSDDE
jgi:serine/threonine protein kinase